MTSHVIDMNEGGRAVTWTQDLVPNLVSRIGVMVSWYAAAITAPRPHHLIALAEVGDTGKAFASSPKWRRTNGAYLRSIREHVR